MCYIWCLTLSFHCLLLLSIWWLTFLLLLSWEQWWNIQKIAETHSAKSPQSPVPSPQTIANNDKHVNDTDNWPIMLGWTGWRRGRWLVACGLWAVAWGKPSPFLPSKTPKTRKSCHKLPCKNFEFHSIFSNQFWKIFIAMIFNFLENFSNPTYPPTIEELPRKGTTHNP